MKAIPRWLKIVLALVAVVLVIGLVAPLFLDVDRYRATILESIEAETGRKAEIGKIRARLLPSVGFTIENFKLGNPPGFVEGNVLEVTAIRGSLAWLPLLRREFQLSSIELEHPKLVLLEDNRGRTNYDFSSKKSAKKRAAEEEGGFRIADIDSIELSDVELIMGTVSGRRVTQTLRASNLNADVANLALDVKRIKQWEANASLRGAKVELAALRNPIQFTSGDFTLREGKATSKFAADFARVADVSGSLRVADVEKAVVDFELSTSTLDLDKLLAASAGGGGGSSGGGGSRRSELLAKGKISAKRVVWAPLEASQASAEMRLFTDRMEIWPFSMGLYGGTLGASVRVDQRPSPERFSANLDLKQLDVGALTTALGSAQKITGTGNLTLQTYGSLGANVLNSLTGSGNLEVRDGTLPGLNLGGTLSKVTKALNFGGGGANNTPFTAITADLNLRGGRIHSQRIHLDSPSGTVDMRGSLGFDQTLAYDGNAVLSTAGGGGGAAGAAGQIIGGLLGQVTKQQVSEVSVPFAVSGTMSDPKVVPGRGIPGFRTAAPAQAAETQPQEEEKKKSLLDLFRKP